LKVDKNALFFRFCLCNFNKKHTNGHNSKENTGIYIGFIVKYYVVHNNEKDKKQEVKTNGKKICLFVLRRRR